MICRLLLSLSLLNCIPLTGSGTVGLSGSGNGYAGVEMRLYSQTDPVSKRLMPVSRVRCDSSGYFSCRLPFAGDGLLFLKAGIFSFFLYTSEGSDYIVKLPDFVRKPAGEEFNPFFVETRIIPEVINNQRDINNLIRTFDAEFNPVYNEVADRIFKNYRTNEIPGLIQRLNRLTGLDTSAFYSDFVKFRMIMLNQVAHGEYQYRMEDSIMINKIFLSDNPAYIDLINQQFSGYFGILSNSPLKNEYLKAISTSSAGGLKEVLRKDGKAVDKTLQEYVILLNLYSEYYNGTVAPDNARRIISELISSGSVPYIRKTATTLLDKITSLIKGSIPPGFTLSNSGGKPVSPDEFKGKYLLVSFARSDSPYSIEEYRIINNWFKEYSDDLQILTILTDNDFHGACLKMKKLGFSWEMLDGSRDDLLEYSYDIKMYPSFMLINREGRIEVPNCPFPSEDLESFIRKIISGK